MRMIYDFHCAHCGHNFDEFADSEEYVKDKAQIVTECPDCGKDAHVQTIQVATHGGNHSSWSV